MNTGRHRQLGKHSVSAVCFPRSAFVLRGTRGSPCLRPYYIMNYCLASFARTKPIDPRRASSKSFQKKKNNNNNCCETRSKTFFHGKRKKKRGGDRSVRWIPSSSSCLSNTSSSWSSNVCPRVLRIVLTFSFSIRPDLVESNMEKALLSTVKNNRILFSRCRFDNIYIYIFFSNASKLVLRQRESVSFRRSAFSCVFVRKIYGEYDRCCCWKQPSNKSIPFGRRSSSRPPPRLEDRSILFEVRSAFVYAFRGNKMRGPAVLQKD